MVNEKDKIKEEVEELLKPLDKNINSGKERLENELEKISDEKVKELFKTALEKEIKEIIEVRKQIATIYEQNIRELIKEKNKDEDMKKK